MNDVESNASTPHIDQGWGERFIVEQRLADRTGAQIGDALATVDAHCGESGESAQEAFGDPAAYSQSLVGERGGEVTRISSRTTLGIACGLISLLVVPRAIESWITGASFTASAGDLVGWAVVAALAAVVLIWPTPVLTWLFRNPRKVFALPFAVLILLIIPQALLRGTVLDVGWGAPLVAGLVLLGLSVVLAWPDLSGVDPVRDPRVGSPAGATLAKGWFTALMFPVLTVIIVGMDALFRTLM